MGYRSGVAVVSWRIVGGSASALSGREDINRLAKGRRRGAGGARGPTGRDVRQDPVRRNSSTFT